MAFTGNFMVRYSHVLLAGLCVLVASCLGQSGYSGSADQDNSRGRLNLWLTDAPVDSAAEVVVQFSGVELKNGTQTLLLYFCEDPANPAATITSTSPCAKPKPASIDLLAMHSGRSALLLSNYPLAAGHYNSVRLMVDAVAGDDDSYIVLTSATTPAPKYELEIPGDAEAGLQLNRGFDITAGGILDLTIDFDLRKSTQGSAGSYQLRPSLRMVDTVKTGFITGSVYGDQDAALTATSCTSAVYVYPAWNATTGDVGSSTGPLTSAVINITPLSNGDFAYGYKAAFLEAGDYTVAYTCQSAIDDPATDDNISFLRTANVSVPLQGSVTQNFQ